MHKLIESFNDNNYTFTIEEIKDSMEAGIYFPKMFIYKNNEVIGTFWIGSGPLAKEQLIIYNKVTNLFSCCGLIDKLFIESVLNINFSNNVIEKYENIYLIYKLNNFINL